MLQPREADTRLVLHSSHAAHRCESIVVRTPDTDVIEILTGTQKLIIPAELFVEKGVGDRKIIIDIKGITSSLRELTYLDFIRTYIS